MNEDNTAKEILAALNEIQIENGRTPLKHATSKREMLAQINFNRPEVEEPASNLSVFEEVLEETEEISNVAQFPIVELEESSVLSQVLDPLRAKGGLFTPAEVELRLPNDDIVPDKKAIIDSETGEYVSTVGRSYNLISNQEVFTQFANVLNESSLNTSGMNVIPTVTKSRSYVQFTFPEHRVEIGDDDFTELQIVARNSYDGSLRFSLEIGGFRLLCSNGMGIGSYTNVYSNKHSSGYDPEKMREYLEVAVEVFETAGEDWKAMTKINVTDEQAFEVLKIMAERISSADYNEVLTGKDTVLKGTLAEWERYKLELGSNKFALYNTITHLSSHAKTKKGCVVGLRIHKEKLRDKALSSKFFTGLKAA